MKTSGYEPAVTEFNIIQYLGDNTLLEAKLITGKTHQIRAHIAYYGYPIVGDNKYGKDDVAQIITFGTLAARGVIRDVGRVLDKVEDNLLVYNLLLAFLSEVVIIGMAALGIGTHPDRIMIGIVMLLISALSTTNGIREVLQRDFISGLINIMNSVLGAAGIAFGIALAMWLLGEGEYDGFILNNSVPVQLVSCTVACIGFALWFKIRGRQVLFCGVGAFFTWAIYVVTFAVWPSNFAATLAGGIFVAAYAFVMSRVNKAPATIFLTASAFPLIPGPNLYYMMYGWVSGDSAMAGNETWVLLETCLAIALGFLIVDVVSRYVLYIRTREKTPGQNII